MKGVLAGTLPPTIKSPSDKPCAVLVTVKVVPEGVDVNTFYPEDSQTTLDYVDGRFKFILFGRWDYRKSTKEIIETFLKEFDPLEPVDLIISVDNPYSGDSHGTTEKRLEHYELIDERIKIKHFPSREDYITYLKNGHVFLSCARSEGWNLPLIEAMACGTPSIYSDCSGQTEFARGKGLPVKIIGEKSTQGNNYSNFGINLEDKHIPGNYYEPDYKDLARVMRDAYENYVDHKKRAVEEAKIMCGLVLVLFNDEIKVFVKLILVLNITSSSLDLFKPAKWTITSQFLTKSSILDSSSKKFL